MINGSSHALSLLSSLCAEQAHGKSMECQRDMTWLARPSVFLVWVELARYFWLQRIMPLWTRTKTLFFFFFVEEIGLSQHVPFMFSLSHRPLPSEPRLSEWS